LTYYNCVTINISLLFRRQLLELEKEAIEAGVLESPVAETEPEIPPQNSEPPENSTVVLETPP